MLNTTQATWTSMAIALAVTSAAMTAPAQGQNRTTTLRFQYAGWQRAAQSSKAQSRTMQSKAAQKKATLSRASKANSKAKMATSRASKANSKAKMATSRASKANSKAKLAKSQASKMSTAERVRRTMQDAQKSSAASRSPQGSKSLKRKPSQREASGVAKLAKAGNQKQDNIASKVRGVIEQAAKDEKRDAERTRRIIQALYEQNEAKRKSRSAKGSLSLKPAETTVLPPSEPETVMLLPLPLPEESDAPMLISPDTPEEKKNSKSKKGKSNGKSSKKAKNKK